MDNNNGDEISRYFLPDQEVFASIFHIFSFKLIFCDLRAEESFRFFFLACCLVIYCVIQNCFSCLIKIIILKISSNKWLVSPELRFFYSWAFSFKKMIMDATIDFCASLAQSVSIWIKTTKKKWKQISLLKSLAW